MSKKNFDTLIMRMPMMKIHMLGLEAAITAAADMPSNPPVIAVRRCMRSTNDPSNGDAPIANSVIMSARPSRDRLTPKSSLMLARKGGAKRKQALAVRRATVSGRT